MSRRLIVLTLAAALALAGCGPDAEPKATFKSPAGPLTDVEGAALVKRVTLPADALLPMSLPAKPDLDEVDAASSPVRVGCGTGLSSAQEFQSAHVRAWDASTDRYELDLGNYVALSAGYLHAELKTGQLLESITARTVKCEGYMFEVPFTAAQATGSVAYCLAHSDSEAGEWTECVVYVGLDRPGHTLLAAFSYQDPETARAKAGLLRMAPKVAEQLTKA